MKLLTCPVCQKRFWKRPTSRRLKYCSTSCKQKNHRRNMTAEAKAHRSRKNAEWHARNPEYMREHYRQNRERYLAASSARQKAHPERQRAYQRRYKYGVTQAQYDEMLQAQNNACALCGGNGGKKPLCVDHCHETGVVRGLLCHVCNVCLGRFGDNVEGITRVLNYLQRATP